MERSIAVPRAARTFGTLREELRIEFIRKGIHLSIGFVPTLASIDLTATLILLGFGTLAYTLCESLRMSGRSVPIISKLTFLAARRRDAGKFVMGPITLGLGAMLSLLLYPNPAASLAIYALAFGDGLSSLVGKSFGSIRLPFTGGKSLEGSMTCLLAVFFAGYALSGDIIRSLGIAVAATFIEAAPLKDLDNIVMPVLTGAVAVLLL